jgi:hypothetical protein
MRRRVPVLTLFLASLLSAVAGPGSLPPPDRLLPQLRSRLGLATNEFDRAASLALIEKFGGTLVDPTAEPAPPEAGEVLAGKRRFEGDILYLRVGQVSSGLAPQLRAALEDGEWTRNAVGLVLDLRFAWGNSFEAAGQAGILFSGAAGDILDWGAGRTTVDGTASVWRKPVAVLVNGETRGAAGALAAVLRREASAILVGRATGGDLAVVEEFDLDGGGRIRLPLAAVRLGDGSVLPRGGLEPDILVRGSTGEDRLHLEDPFATPVRGSGNPGESKPVDPASSPRRRINEADLVRAQRDGLLPGDAKTEVKASPVVRDPALARGLDVLRGLAILKKS